MAMKTFFIVANDVEVGEYAAETKEAALRECAKNSDCDDVSEFFSAANGDVAIFEIDVEALYEAVREKTGGVVFESVYDKSGSAPETTFINETRDGYEHSQYLTYKDLAERIERKITDFLVAS